MIPWSVQLIWAVLLVIVYLSLPLAVVALHRLWRSARHIQRYLADMETAAAGIAAGTGSLGGLNQTIDGAGTLLEVAGKIASASGTIRKTLAERAGATGEEGP